MGMIMHENYANVDKRRSFCKQNRKRAVFVEMHDANPRHFHQFKKSCF